MYSPNSRSDADCCAAITHGTTSRSTNASVPRPRGGCGPSSAASRLTWRSAVCNRPSPARVRNGAGADSAAESARPSLGVAAMVVYSARLETVMRQLEGLDRELALGRIEIRDLPLH